MGEKLRAARKAAGLTQAQLAAAVGVQQRDISRWESDKHQPRVEMVKRLATALGCGTAALL